MPSLSEIVSYLDSYLRIREVPDDANALNGLQVENGGTIARIVAAVDASQATIDGVIRGSSPRGEATIGLGTVGGALLGRAAPTSGPALLLVHHGMFWDGHGTATGRRYQKLSALYRSDTALYSAHIPLDLHPEVGNNAVLAERLGIGPIDWFGLHKGVPIGVAGAAPPTLQRRDALVPNLAKALAIGPGAIKLIPGGPERVQRIGIITGGAGTAIAKAKEAGCDTFITGEGAAHTYFDAMELGINVIYAGHYATETAGVQALAAHLGTKFGVPWEFHDHPTGL